MTTITNFSWKPQNKRIWIAGHGGLVGGALTRRLTAEDCTVLTEGRAALDLRRQADVEGWIRANRPDAVIIAAATVGGIGDNASRPADFLYDNLMIAANIIHAAHGAGVGRLLFLGSSCIYPRDASQPIGEGALLTGALEPTNEAYAIAKIAGVRLCQYYVRQHGRAYIAAMPCNLYGPGDRFDAVRSHVIPAIMMKMHQARTAKLPSVTLWGTGAPLREFLYADDLADALLHLMTHYDGESPVNVGSGIECSILELAREIAAVTGFTGGIRFDATKPDGAPRKLVDSGRIRALGWEPRTDLHYGLVETYRWFCEQTVDAPQRTMVGD
jgi:GDP-L-fucose synthase